MSEHEWTPGELWLLNEDSGYSGDERILFRTDRRWVDAEGDKRDLSDSSVKRLAHPLVVIDPEDREQVERLAECYLSNVGLAIGLPLASKRIAHALREFADPKPPKPEEPLGLGAIVLDVKGDRWANLIDTTISRHDQHWMSVRNPKLWSDYADINVVEVLSEGVTA